MFFYNMSYEFLKTHPFYPRLQKALETPEEARIPYALDASLHGEPSTLDIDLIASPRAFANRGKILRFFPCDFAAHVPQ